MKTSQNGIGMIKELEGCKLTAYKCPANVWTIGYGHTAGVTAGMRITQEKAESYLKDDLVKFENKVMKYNSTYRWNQNELDALVSFSYNIGSIDQLTAGGTRSRAEIALKMLSYNKAAGKELPGLTARRKTEQVLFKTTNSTTSGNIQAAEQEDERTAGHIQINYKPSDTYTVLVDNLIIRTKPSEKNGQVIKGAQLGSLNTEDKIKNQATMRIQNQIWMYIGLNKKSQEQWVCADTGAKAYVIQACCGQNITQELD